MQLRI